MINSVIPPEIKIKIKLLPFGTIQVFNGNNSQIQLLEKQKENKVGYEFPTDTVISKITVFEVPDSVITV